MFQFHQVNMAFNHLGRRNWIWPISAHLVCPSRLLGNILNRILTENIPRYWFVVSWALLLEECACNYLEAFVNRVNGYILSI